MSWWSKWIDSLSKEKEPVPVPDSEPKRYEFTDGTSKVVIHGTLIATARNRADLWKCYRLRSGKLCVTVANNKEYVRSVYNNFEEMKNDMLCYYVLTESVAQALDIWEVRVYE